MSEIDELLSRLPIDQIAEQLGTDPTTARAAAEAALPSLVAGLGNNAQEPAGAAALEGALAEHRDGLADGGVDLSGVDTADGEKIVAHAFAGQQDDVAARLAGAAQLGGVGGELVRRLLPMLAPIVMSWLAGKVFGRQGAPSGPAQAPADGGLGGGVLGDLLGGMLGGAAGGHAGQTGQTGQGGLGGVLGDLLGGVLGGRQSTSDAGQDRASGHQAGVDQTGIDQAGQGPVLPGAAPSESGLTPGEVVDPGQR
ncbi:DUF937 domain-containing protein [Sinomonas halotolerans]|uniref:DUF937 domain-containing protein n=1 Tax=Sinomonas halotolerans TaxID=1644133 RepID=A0ABU9WVL9_9MICC